MSPAKRTRLARNIYQDAHGISGIVRRPGYTEEIRFAKGTAVPEIRRELEAREEELAEEYPDRPERGSLASIVELIIKRQPTDAKQADCRQLLAPWVQALGPKPWPRVTRADLSGVLDDWRKAGLSEGRIRKRITRLRAGWKAIAPDRAPAHAIERLPLPAEPKPTAIRARPMALVELVLAHVTEHKTAKRDTPQPASKTRVRLGVMAWTGQPPARVMAIQPEHVRWDTTPAELYVSPRRKAAGSDDAWLPLLPQAVVWLKAFFAAKATGPFELSPMGRSWQRAIKKAQRALRAAKRDDEAALLDGFRVYDLRHSFLTMLGATADDIYAVKEYAGHASLQTTLRYMRGAASARTRAAIAKLTPRDGSQ